MKKLIEVAIDGEPDIRGYLAIDAAVNGRSYGGVRISPNLSPDSLARVARAKTLKYGLLGLPVGGAKAGISADPDMPLQRKREILKKFGKGLGEILRSKSFIPSEDMGTDENDIRYMVESNGVSVPPRSLNHRLSGYYTSITILTAAKQAVKHINIEPDNITVAVEGFGNVGANTALAFWQNGFKVVAVSNHKSAVYDKAGLDIGMLFELRKKANNNAINLYPGGQRIDGSSLLELDIDIFSPCAQADSITADNAGRISANIICPGANAPVQPDA